MQNAQPNLFSRDDTFLGVCEGLGQDLGISPNLLRLALIPLLFFYPVAAIGGYFAAGAVVLLSRVLFPNPRVAAAVQPAVEHQTAAAEEGADRDPVPLAA